MGTLLVYGLKTTDASYLYQFFPSKRLNEAAAALGIADQWSMSIFYPGSDIDSCVETAAGQRVLMRGELPMELYQAMEARGIRTVNKAQAVQTARDKLATVEFCRKHGLPHPHTVELTPTMEQPPLDYPFVVKPRYGKMGKGVRLIENPEQYKQVRSEENLLAQEYVQHSYGRDVRFFFAAWPGGTDFLCVSRHSASWLSNAHQGGHMSVFSPHDELVSMAQTAFTHSGLDYGTVDFLFADKGGSSFTLCELNACPGFEELERATGCDGARAILTRTLECRP